MHSIRYAHKNDLEQLLTIEQDCFSCDKINRRQMWYLLTKAKALTLIAENPVEIMMGYCIGFTPLAYQTARLYSLAVMSTYRGYGVGSALLKALLQELRERHYYYCTLEVRNSDKQVQALYHRVGFCPVKYLPAYYADGEDALRMRLSLNEMR